MRQAFRWYFRALRAVATPKVKGLTNEATLTPQLLHQGQLSVYYFRPINQHVIRCIVYYAVHLQNRIKKYVPICKERQETIVKHDYLKISPSGMQITSNEVDARNSSLTQDLCIINRICIIK